MLDFHTKHDKAFPPHSAILAGSYNHYEIVLIWVMPFRAQASHPACGITRYIWHLLQSRVVVVSVEPHKQRLSTEGATML